MLSQIVIVGAGQAAAQLIASLAQDGFTGSVTLIGDEPYLPYQRPPLSKKFLAGELASIASMCGRPPSTRRPAPG